MVGRPLKKGEAVGRLLPVKFYDPQSLKLMGTYYVLTHIPDIYVQIEMIGISFLEGSLYGLDGKSFCESDNKFFISVECAKKARPALSTLIDVAVEKAIDSDKAQ